MLEPSAVIECCKSLILYDVSSGLVRFTHETVQEYIASNMKQSIPRPSDLAKTCLTYLAFDEFDVQGSEKAFVENRLKNYNFGRYAACFWAFHTKEAEESPDVQEAVFACLVSEAKRNSMLQIATYARRGISFTRGQTLLHVLAENGLAKICALVLDDRLIEKHGYQLCRFPLIRASTQMSPPWTVKETQHCTGRRPLVTTT
jgi:hypothetical protein